MVSVNRKQQLKCSQHATKHNDKLPIENNIVYGRMSGKGREEQTKGIVDSEHEGLHGIISNRDS